jgi:hypothetical protein
MYWVGQVDFGLGETKTTDRDVFNKNNIIDTKLEFPTPIVWYISNKSDVFKTERKRAPVPCFKNAELLTCK